MANINKVGQGDRITAQFMNTLIDAIQALELQVKALQAGTTGSPGPLITAILSQGVDITTLPALHTNDPLEIFGQNFGFSRGAQYVSFNGLQNASFKQGSNDSLLLLNIPPTLTVDENGTPVTMLIGNGLGSVTRTITVKPPDVPITSDAVDVLFKTVSPNPLEASKPATITYTIASRLAKTTTFTLSPHISTANWPADNQLVALDELLQPLPGQNITLAPLQQKTFSIRIPSVPAAPGPSFDMKLSASAQGAVIATTDTIPVGSVVVQLSFSAIAERVDFLTQGLPNANGGSFDKNDPEHKVKVKAGSAAQIKIDTSFAEKDTYDYKVELKSGAGWKALLDPASPPTIAPSRFPDDLPPGAKITVSPIVNVAPQNNATASADLEFRIERKSSAQKVVIAFKLILM